MNARFFVWGVVDWTECGVTAIIHGRVGLWAGLASFI